MLDVNALKEIEASGKLRGMFAVDNETYHTGPGVGSTGLKLLLDKSPKHFHYRNNNGWYEKKNSDALLVGGYIHEAVLQPFVFQNSYTTTTVLGLDESDSRKNSYKSAIAEHEQKTGQKVLDVETWDMVVGASQAVLNHPILCGLLKDGQTEQALYWQDRKSGILCRTKPDFLRTDGIIVDLKTTGSDGFRGTDYDAFSHAITSHKYHLSAAMALSGLSELVGRTMDKYIFAAVEKEPPYACGAYELDFGSLEKGEDLFHKALAIYSNCTSSGHWPDYTTEIRPISIKAWAF